jgi:hypothetical protein
MGRVRPRFLRPRGEAAAGRSAFLLRLPPSAGFLGLLTDQQVERLSPAGWKLVLRGHALAGDALEDATFELLAVAVGSDELLIALLREAPVDSSACRSIQSLNQCRRLLSKSPAAPTTDSPSIGGEQLP